MAHPEAKFIMCFCNTIVGQEQSPFKQEKLERKNK